MRLGEQLVAEGLVAQSGVDECLEAQVVEGGRLGTNLVERGYIKLDVLSEALARQHDMAAALDKHFVNADPEIQKRLPPELAARWHCIPLGLLSRDPVTFAAVATDPLPSDGVAEVERAMGGEIVLAIAPELRVLYHLERVYDIPRLNRFRRTRKSDAEETPAADANEAAERERRRYVRPVSEAGVQAPNALARIAIRKIRVVSGEFEKLTTITSMDDALAAMRRSTGRESLGQSAISALEACFEPALETAMLLVFRGGVAIGWTGFVAGGEDHLVEGIAVSLAEPSFLRNAAQTKVAYIGAPTAPSDVDHAIWRGLGSETPGAIAVVPVLLGDKLAAAIYAHRSTSFDGDESERFHSLADGISGAFLRLIRAAER